MGISDRKLPWGDINRYSPNKVNFRMLEEGHDDRIF